MNLGIGSELQKKMMKHNANLAGDFYLNYFATVDQNDTYHALRKHEVY